MSDDKKKRKPGPKPRPMLEPLAPLAADGPTVALPSPVATAPVEGVGQVRQPHGGALNAGGTPGNAGNPGAFSLSANIRHGLRTDYDRTRGFLLDVASGELVQTSEAALKDLLPHAHCPKCGDRLQHELDDERLSTIRIEVKKTATIDQRMRALEQMAHYGLGQLKELSTDDVRARIARMIELFRVELPEALLARILPPLKAIWR